MSANPSLAEVLKLAVREGTAKIHTTCPAVVISYDPDSQTVSARIVVRTRYKTADGEIKDVAGPILSGVPVLFPHSAGGYGLTFPLIAGDWVTLHVSERSLSEWKATGNTDITAGDLRRFDYSDCYAYPGGQPPVSPIGATGRSAAAMVLEGADIRLGSSAASDAVALATPTDSNFTKILNLLQTWIPVPADGGAALKAAALLLTNDATGATKVKAE